MKIHGEFSKYKEVLTDGFINHNWDRLPASLSLSAGFSFVEETVLLAGLRNYLSRMPELKRRNALAEYVTALDSKKTARPLEALTVGEEDTCLDSFLDRAQRAAEGREWSIAYFGLHGASAAVWDETKGFLETLYSRIGYRPAGRVDVDCFIGRYSSTPSGIHVDGAHNFSFTYRDGKTMYTWPPGRQDLLWKKSPHYDDAKPESVPLMNTMDCLCYFPHDYLHVGETSGRASCNVNVSIWRHPQDHHATSDYLAARLKTVETIQLPLAANGASPLPAHELENLRRIRMLLDDDAIEQQMAVSELFAQTTANMKVARPVETGGAVRSTGWFRRRSSSSIQWYLLSSGRRMLIAGNGHCIVTARDNATLELLAEICEAAPDHVIAWPGDAAGELTLLLVQWGVIEALDSNTVLPRLAGNSQFSCRA